MRRRVLVLTGPVHSGKTTFLKGAAAFWDLAGIGVGGFLNETCLDGGKVQGYDLVDLRGGASVPFLRTTGEPGWQRVGGFSLVPGGLERAEGILARDIEADILVVDEVGLLELSGLGLWPALSAALSAGAGCVCVVRTSILEEFRAKMGKRRIDVFRQGDPDVLECLTRRILREVGMKVRVKFFAYFREAFDGREREIVLPKGSTVGDLLDVVCDTPKRRAEIFKGNVLKPLIIVMKNGTSINSLDGLETKIEDDDVIAVFPFIAGG
jgi:MoaD family protein